MTASACHPTTPRVPPQFVGILDRAVLVLGAFDRGGLSTLTDVVGRTGLPRSSARRRIVRLVRASP